MSFKETLLKAYQDNQNKVKQVVPLWTVGDIVRVLKHLEINVYEVEDLLGQCGEVVEVQKIGKISGTLINYRILFSDGRVEPLEEDELDKRFKSKAIK